MIVVFPFSLVDEDLALKNAKWMNELGGCKGHQVLVCYDARCRAETIEAIGQELLKCFDKVWRLRADLQFDGWPQGANYFFRLSTTWLQDKPADWPYFLWLEPDAIPMKPGWVDALEAEYRRAGRPFMGDKVDLRDVKPEVPLHMSGIGIYENPIYKTAGECYRAHDVAWDIAAMYQIVPNAHWTRQIEHAWKHPKFTSIDELKTQIRAECVLFHSSKDGSLIDLLRRGRTATPDLKADAVGQAGSTPVAATRTIFPMPVFDIFIRTYPGDYAWLDYCLQSIGKFCSGFRRIFIVSTASPNDALKLLMQGFGGQAIWILCRDETPDGYLAQQITKMHADQFSAADYILHIDSDTLFKWPVTPQDYFDHEDRLLWYYTPYPIWYTPPGHTEKKLVHWQPITEKFMQMPVPFEFMRQLPIMIPKWLYPKLRDYCMSIHNKTISSYVGEQPAREFSEFNAWGALAYFNHPDQFRWVNTLEVTMAAPLARQFHSWGGITPEVEAEINTILHGADSQIHKVLQPETAAAGPLPEAPATNPPGESVPMQSMSVAEEIRAHVDRLKHFASTTPQNKSEVMRCLVAANLKSPKPKKKKAAAPWP